VHLFGFITKKFVTMHGHLNVKFVRIYRDNRRSRYMYNVTEYFYCNVGQTDLGLAYHSGFFHCY